MVFECEHSEPVLVEFCPLISESESEKCEICHEILLVFFEYSLAGCTTELHIEDEVEIFTEAKVWEIYLIQTSSSLEYEISVFFSELDEDNCENEVFLEFEWIKILRIRSR